MKAPSVLVVVLLTCGCVSNRHATNLGSNELHSTTGSVEIRGEVRHPGTYVYTAGMNVADVVSAAGGLNDFAHGLILIRNGKKLVDRYSIEMSKLLKTRISNGDTVYIMRTRD